MGNVSVHYMPLNDLEYKITFNHRIKSDKEKEMAIHYDKKLDNSISRSKKTIKEIALCNEWKWFVTLTLDKTKLDRYDMNAYHKKLRKFIENYNHIHCCKIAYVMIPELHKDGAIHIHALFNDIPMQDLKPFGLEEKLPKKIRELLLRGFKVYHWLQYENSFGWNTFNEIYDSTAIAHYMMKYITKKPCVEELGKHLYYCSRGLQRADLIANFDLDINDYEGELDNIFSNRFVTTGYTKNPEEILNYSFKHLNK